MNSRSCSREIGKQRDIKNEYTRIFGYFVFLTLDQWQVSLPRFIPVPCILSFFFFKRKFDPISLSRVKVAAYATFEWNESQL